MSPLASHFWSAPLVEHPAATPLAAVLIAAGTIAALWVAALRCPCETPPGVPVEGTGTPGVPLLALALLTPDDPRLPVDPVDAAVEDWALVLGGDR